MYDKLQLVARQTKVCRTDFVGLVRVGEGGLILDWLVGWFEVKFFHRQEEPGSKESQQSSRLWQVESCILTTTPSLTVGLLPRPSLLDLLQNPVSMIAGDQRDAFVGLQVSQQRHELVRI